MHTYIHNYCMFVFSAGRLLQDKCKLSRLKVKSLETQVLLLYKICTRSSVQASGSCRKQVLTQPIQTGGVDYKRVLTIKGC